MNTKYIWLLLIFIGFTACNEIEDIDKLEPVEELPALTAGSANFSKYVALGASFTAGYTDGAVFIAGQQNSFPNILSQQFALVGGGAFSQPLMKDNIGGFVAGSTVVAAPRFYFNGTGPVRLAATPTTQLTANLGGVFSNVGVPGAKSTHVNFAGYASLNPYFGRMATSASITMLDYASAQSPTFFTLSEIGGNDVLGYATTGGDGTDPITPSATFNAVFEQMVNKLTLNGAKGAVTNVPYVKDLPHFTAVAYNAVPLDAATAASLNAAFAAYNAGLQGVLNAINANLIPAAAAPNFNQAEVNKRKVNFVAGKNALLILDETLSNLTGINPALTNMRQATAADLIVLSAGSFIGTTVGGNAQLINGVSVPLADKWVLLPSEQAELKTATDAYNAKIASYTASKGLALVDLNAVLTQASTTGINSGNFVLNTKLVTGGLVSLDGIHLTARGYAVMANKFLEAIDATYGSNFVASGNLAKAGNYPTNYSPLLR